MSYAVAVDVAERAPVSFRGRAVFTWDAADAAAITDAALERACRPERLTLERVRAYCQWRGRDSAALERAVLRESLRVVSPSLLVERVAARVRATRGEQSLGVRVTFGAAPAEEPRAPCAIPGRLRLQGRLSRGAEGCDIDARWVVPGGTALDFARDARQAWDELVAVAAGGALSRLGDAVLWRLRTQLDSRCEPPVLAALRAAPVPPRAYRMYWRRLRDYLVWCASHDV